MELEAGVTPPSPRKESHFDVGRNIAVVPPFRESEVDSYFSAFERVAAALQWPKEVWLLQCKLPGKAQEVVASLSIEDSLQYETVKATVLRAYELVPEPYRQGFRHHKKGSNQTFVEFARDKESLFDRWCNASKVTEYAGLRELMLLEDFKNHLPDRIVVHVNERKVPTLSEAAVMEDEYALTHKTVFTTPTSEVRTNTSQVARSSSYVADPPSSPGKDMRECYYCHREGHLIANCPTLKNKPRPPMSPPQKKKPVGFVRSEELDCGYSPFVSSGWVSLSGVTANQQPVQVLRDTGAAQTIILSDVLPWSAESYCGSHVLLTGIEMGTVSVPLHWVYLSSGLVSGRFRVGVVLKLPVKGVALLLGNDLAGGRVVPVMEVLDKPDPTHLNADPKGNLNHPAFPACAVTRA